ncbi:DUF1573 domain-containing protein [Oleiharenicola lentus]|uniref:DUF1573 domain-containing protein n=1 Tax=Oleiharenicola lentus TaxID=2508720 RepID=UPI003F67D556
MLFAVFAAQSFALDWQVKTLTFTTVPFQAKQEVLFEFRNNSSKAVTILDVQTNCDCLEASADQKIYAPGTGGVIKANYRVGERAGLTERGIAVVTDESPEPVRLLVRIEVPEITSIEPRNVSWRVSAENAEKIIELKPASGLEIHFADAKATNPSFEVRLEIVEPNKHYRLHVKPVSTAQRASAAIRIFGREKSGRDLIVSAYAIVQ